MKRSLKLFNKKGKKPSRGEEILDLDEEYGEDYDENYDEGYEDDDYPDEEFEQEYGDSEEYPEEDNVEEDYPEEDYPDEDYREDDEYDSDEADDGYEDERDYPGARGRFVDYPDEEVQEDSYRDEVRYREDNQKADAVDDRDYRDERDYPEDEDYRAEDYGDDGDYREQEDYPEDDYEKDVDRDYRDDDYDGDGDYRDDDYSPDEDYEDEEYYEDEYYEEDENINDREHSRGGRRNHSGESVGAKILDFIKETSFAERAAAVVALILVVGGIFTLSFYSKALNRTKEIGSFAEVGANLSVSEVVGETGLLAVADAERAKAIASNLLEEEEEEQTVADDAKGVTIQMTLTTIKSDMKIKFINSQSGKLVSNVPFTVTVVTPDGSSVNYDDHDKDGIIYKKDLTAGTYKVTPNALPADYGNYTLDMSSKSLTIKDTVEMKAVDVSNEIKKESQVNAAVEDTAQKTVVESELKDTVDWVESNQNSATSSDGKYSYESVDRNSVSDPSTTSKLTAGSVKRLSKARARTENPEEKPSEDNSSSSEGTTDSASESTTDSSSEASTDSSTGASSDSSTGGSTDSSTGGSTDSSTGATTDSSSGSSTESSTGASTEEKKDETKTMTLSQSSLTLKVGESSSVKANEPSSATYTSDNTGVATVSDDGTVKAIGVGTATIKVTASGYESASASVTVNAADVKTVSVEQKSISLKVNGTYKIKVTDPSNPTFASDKTSVATVSGDGTVTAVSEGSAVITVSASGYKEATVAVTVSKNEKGAIELSSKIMTLEVGGSKKIIVNKGPSVVNYYSEGENIATVKSDGTVTGVAEGTVKIKVTGENYDAAELTVTVVKKGTEFKLNISQATLVVGGKTVKIGPLDSNLKPTYSSSNTEVATVNEEGTISPVAQGETTIVAKCDGYADYVVTVKVLANSTVLKDKDGNTLYVKQEDDSYREATYADYYSDVTLYLRRENADAGTRYGWWTVDGKTYYYDKNGNAVTGEQVIKGAKYTFGSDGVLSDSSGTLGIDVSKWNGNIDWNKVKNSGVNYVIIRCGYRGSSAGALIEDPKFKSNIQGAQNAGLKVGVYFFTQAVNEVEAVEEASMVIGLIKGYSLNFPVYLDVEASGGRGDGISASQRTANIKAFCGTIQNAGYSAGVYANKTWFTSHINTSSITNYKIWLAQYTASVSYTASRYDMWQYTSKGSISGISGNVDMNILYR